MHFKAAIKAEGNSIMLSDNGIRLFRISYYVVEVD